MELRSVAYNPTPAPGMGGMMPGMQDMQGMQSGMQGMQPGMQGMQPGMQGMQPGMQGMHPEMQGMSEMERMLHGMHGVPGMYQHLDMDPCCPLPCPCPAYETHHCPMPAPGPAPTPAPEVYVVKKGDTIYKIAKRHGTTMQAIILANNLRNPNLIYPGQILLIPAASTADFRG
ncbi:MAG TPA: LysM peptidoglycan-binding domain-containing protein [Desulfosporosinus sp.]